MRKLLRLTASILPALLFFIVLTFPVQALYVKSDKNLTLSKDEIFDETVIVSGENLVIDSVINGDLICAGQKVTVNGDVNGDIICAAQILTINGFVDGNVRVAGQTVEINGLVERNVTAFSQTLTVENTSIIKGDLFFGVQTVDLKGKFGRDMAGAGETIIITGSLLKDALITAPSILVEKTATIGGNLVYYIDENGMVEIDKSQVGGDITRHQIETKQVPERNRENVAGAVFMGVVLGVLSSIILGLAIIYFLKRALVERTKLIKDKPFVAGLVGFAALILTPLVFIILLMTIIGMPLAFVLLLEYLLSLVTASVYPTIMFGQWVLRSVWKEKAGSHGWSLVVGAVLIGILIVIPVINFFTGLIVLCLGMGAIFLSYLPQSKTK